MIALEQIRERLADAIKTSGITQAEIARRLNIKNPTVNQYLSGRAMPALDTFANICKILDLDANYILCLDEPRDNSKRVTVSESFNNNSGKINFNVKE